MFKRVLVATGGSPWSQAAVAYATTLAASTGAELRILTVLTVHAAYALPDVMASSEMVMESAERQGQELLAEAASAATVAGVPHTTVCKWGSVTETILQTATEEECDLITLGSRVVVGRKRLMLGSISNAVSAKAIQPILVVKQPPPLGANTFMQGRILVATGGSPWSDAALDYTLEMAHNQGCEVCLLTVEPRRSPHGLDLETAAAEHPVLQQAVARAATAGVIYEARLAYGNRVDAILETAANRQCDAIVLGSRGMRGWKRLMVGSISNAVAVKSALPVLLIKQFFRG